MRKCNFILKGWDHLKEYLLFFSQVVYRCLSPLFVMVYNLENISLSFFKNTSSEITWALKHSDASDVIKNSRNTVRRKLIVVLHKKVQQNTSSGL